jgi:apolipoprotein N-acyltransferase
LGGEDAATRTEDGESASDVRERAKGAKKAKKARAAASPLAGPAPLGARAAYGLAFGTGVLYYLGFPGVDVWPLSFIALVPLILALRGQTPRRAAGLGWLAGFTMNMLGFSWLLGMLKVFSGFPTPLCLVFMALLCAYQGGRIALAGYLHGRAARGWPAAPVFALAFVASELVYPLLFPWYFGASVHNMPVFLQTADLGGPYLVALVLVAANLAVAELVQARLDRRPIDRRLVGAGAGVTALAALYGVVRMRSVGQAMEAAPAVEVGIVQGDQPLLDRRSSLAVHQRLTAKLKEEGAELVVWSEAAVPRAFAEEAYRDDVRRVITRSLGVPSIVGTVIARPSQDGVEERRYRLYNTALLADRDGTVLGRYDKQFLLAFGEYLPFGDTFPILYKWSPNSGQFSTGEIIDAMPLDGHRISALICYEDILPGFVNKLVRHGDPDLLVNLTNDSWFGDTSEPWEHFALAKLRAVEHRRFLVRATNSGVSGIIDALGRVVAESQVTVPPQHSTATASSPVTVAGKARWMRARTGYEVVGDGPWWLATAAIAAIAFARRPKRDRSEAAAPTA